MRPPSGDGGEKLYEPRGIRFTMRRSRGLAAGLVLLLLVLILATPPVSAPTTPPNGLLRVDSDTELLGFGTLNGGGKMTWILTEGQAIRLRQKLIAFLDDTFDVEDGQGNPRGALPRPFYNVPAGSLIHPPLDSNWYNGVLDEDEVNHYADFLARHLTSRGRGYEYRYVKLTAANRLQQNLDISASSEGLVGTNALSVDPIELRFWFNAVTLGNDLPVPLPDEKFANAIHEIFSYAYVESFDTGYVRFPNVYPFNVVDGGDFWVDTAGGFLTNRIRSSNPPTYAPGYTSTLATNRSTPLDLRFATTGTLRINWSADTGPGDGLRVEACEWAAGGACAGPWQPLQDTGGTVDFRDTNIATIHSSAFSLDGPANALLGKRWNMRFAFSADANALDDGEGVRIHEYVIDAPSYAQGTIVNNHVDILVGSSNLNYWDFPSGSANYIRTPAGVIGFYSSTFEAGAPPADTVRYQSFDFLENEQILFALVIIVAYVQAYFMDTFFLDAKAKIALRSRATFKRLWWLTWAGRLVILFMILWYFFPGMFSTMGMKVIVPGSFLWVWTLVGSISMIISSYYIYNRRAATLPSAPPPALAVPGSAPVCNNCFNPMTDTADRYRCECGENYHAHCAAQLSACPSCRRPIASPGAAAAVAAIVTVQATCPSCGVSNQVPSDADLAMQRCVACASPLKPLQRGYNYLVVAPSPEPAYRWFNGLLVQGVPGIVLSKTFPEKLKREYGLASAEMYWISDTSPGPKILDPRRLDFEITRAFSNFAKANRGGVVLLDGIEYLVVENGFDKVFKFLKKVNDLSGPNELTLIVPMAPNSLEPESMTMVLKEFDRIEHVGDSQPPPPPPP